MDGRAHPTWVPLGTTDRCQRRYPLLVAGVPDFETAAAAASASEIDGCHKLFIAVQREVVTVNDASVLASAFLDRDCCYMCAWGAACSLLHDVFDETVVIQQIDGHRSPNDLVMTAWHEDVVLERALWFFLDLAEPSGSFNDRCKSSRVLSIGVPGIEAAVRRVLASPGECWD